jgi:hypothetical protein
MMNKALSVALLLAGLSACASAAKPGAMAVAVSQSTLINETSGLHKAIETPAVDGGKETSPLWKSNVSSKDFAEALRQTLAANTMLASDSGRFKLNAALIELKQPLVGLSLTVTARVKYSLSEAAGGKVIWEKEITTPYTAKMGDAFVAVKRLQLANEGAIRENIKQFVEQLVADSKTSVDLQPVAKPVASFFQDNAKQPL